jgi:SAM-dependent methyltransferase
MEEIKKKLLKLDLGCGPNKRQDGAWVGVDALSFEGKVDVVSDIITYLKTLEDESVEEIYMSHVFEHFKNHDRPPLMNEIYRVLIPDGKVTIICPSWSHERAYGDVSHEWPPITSWSFYYMNKEWRDVNAPHCGYICDFNFGISGSHDPNDQYISFRNMETKMTMMAHQINIVTDIIAVLDKKAPK